MNKWLATSPLLLSLLLVSSGLVGCYNKVNASHATVVSTSFQQEGYTRGGTPYGTSYVTLSKNGQAITLHTMNNEMIGMLVKGAEVDFTYDSDSGTIESVVPSQFHDSNKDSDN